MPKTSLTKRERWRSCFSRLRRVSISNISSTTLFQISSSALIREMHLKTPQLFTCRASYSTKLATRSAFFQIIVSISCHMKRSSCLDPKSRSVWVYSSSAERGCTSWNRCPVAPSGPTLCPTTTTCREYLSAKISEQDSSHSRCSRISPRWTMRVKAARAASICFREKQMRCSLSGAASISSRIFCRYLTRLFRSGSCVIIQRGVVQSSRS
mmetsp:Transcript_62945/g.150073  ORF Transcript_62945/g.150073 Transcript_62945/m.150073 type:complete len:211 (-) Transcript_62945:432-1064(-)